MPTAAFRGWGRRYARAALPMPWPGRRERRDLRQLGPRSRHELVHRDDWAGVDRRDAALDLIVAECAFQTMGLAPAWRGDRCRAAPVLRSPRARSAAGQTGLCAGPDSCSGAACAGRAVQASVRSRLLSLSLRQWGSRARAGRWGLIPGFGRAFVLNLHGLGQWLFRGPKGERGAALAAKTAGAVVGAPVPTARCSARCSGANCGGAVMGSRRCGICGAARARVRRRCRARLALDDDRPSVVDRRLSRGLGAGLSGTIQLHASRQRARSRGRGEARREQSRRADVAIIAVVTQRLRHRLVHR